MVSTKALKYYSMLEASGYGLSALSYLTALLDRGCRIQWIPLVMSERGYIPWYNTSNPQFEVKQRLSECLNDEHQVDRLLQCLEPCEDYQTIVMHTVPEYWSHFKELGKQHVGYTVWETSRLPQHFPALINQADRVIVPCTFNQTVFTESGVEIPIEVVPHILNPVVPVASDVLRQVQALLSVPTGNYTFYSIDAWNSRKDIATLVRAYLNTFSADDPVSLVLKTSATGSRSAADTEQRDTQQLVAELAGEHAKSAHIKVLNHTLTHHQIAALHELCDCFVSASHAEGWGLGMFEAAGASNPVIATGWGGHLDFLPCDLSYHTRYALTPVAATAREASYSPDQLWAQADVHSLAQQLRQVAQNPEAAKQRATTLAAILQHKYCSSVVGEQLECAVRGSRIPKLFHFVFGLKEQTEPFHLAFYLCLRSCIEVNRPAVVYFYYHYEPYGEYWNLVKPWLTMIKVDLEPLVQNSTAYQNHQEGQFIKGANLDYAHHADFVRLTKLIEKGGVYADIDTLFVNPIPDELYEHSFVIGAEQTLADGNASQVGPSLCNALLMAEPNAEFAIAWLAASYQSFDGTWSSHSCAQATSLAVQLPHAVHIVPQHYFYKHTYTVEGIRGLFEQLDVDFSDVFSMHMWNHLWWDQARVDFSEFHAGLITEQLVASVDTTYNVIARRFLPRHDESRADAPTTIHSITSQMPVKETKTSSAILIPAIAPGWELIQEAGESRFWQRDTGLRFGINHATKLILDQCDGRKRVDTIIRALSEAFPDAANEISLDVQTILRDLALRGAIKFNQVADTARVYVPVALPPRPTNPSKLCIGMATYDDYDGVYFSIQAIRLYHPEVLKDIEFVVLDNNPSGVCAGPLRSLGNWMPNYRYVPGDNFQGTWSRFALINQTHAPYILCMDSHVMIVPGALRRLLDYIDAHPDSPDFLQGPLLSDDLSSLSSHFTPGWGAGMFGRWDKDVRVDDVDHPPFDIPMQGLGLFAIRRDSWPRVNPRFKGFGGEEGYIHEKVRRAGGRTLCLPFLRWIHRFNRPMGARYALSWEDRIRNYMIAHHELGADNKEMLEHFKAHIGEAETNAIVTKVVAEINNPLFFFDAIYCINKDSETRRWEAASVQFEQLGISHRVQRFAAIETSHNHHIGCALSHRAVVQMASINGYANVLVFEDDVVFDVDTLANLSRSIAEIQAMTWDILYLGGHGWAQSYPHAGACKHVREVTIDIAGPTTTHALAYNHSSYARLLNDFPDSAEQMEYFLMKGLPAIDQYLAHARHLQRLIVEPLVASQPAILKQEALGFKPMYVT